LPGKGWLGLSVPVADELSSATGILEGPLCGRFCICGGNGDVNGSTRGLLSPFLRAEFLAEEPAQPRGRNGRPKP